MNLRGTESSHLTLPKLAVSIGGQHGQCFIHRGPNGEVPPSDLLADATPTAPNRVCENILFCGGSGNTWCNHALNAGGSVPQAATNNILCELPYTPPPPDKPLVDKRLSMIWAKDTTSCPGLPMPSNTRLPNALPSSTGTAYSSENWVLSCQKPKIPDGIANIISNIDTKSIPAGSEGVILNFHYFCGM